MVCLWASHECYGLALCIPETTQKNLVVFTKLGAPRSRLWAKDSSTCELLKKCIQENPGKEWGKGQARQGWSYWSVIYTSLFVPLRAKEALVSNAYVCWWGMSARCWLQSTQKLGDGHIKAKRWGSAELIKGIKGDLSRAGATSPL